METQNHERCESDCTLRGKRPTLNYSSRLCSLTANKGQRATGRLKRKCQPLTWEMESLNRVSSFSHACLCEQWLKYAWACVFDIFCVPEQAELSAEMITITEMEIIISWQQKKRFTCVFSKSCQRFQREQEYNCLCLCDRENKGKRKLCHSDFEKRRQKV